MPFALLIIGALLLVAGIRGTASQLFGLLKADFYDGISTTSFVAWVVAILLIGSVGYVKKLQPISDGLLLLLVVVLALVKGQGFFDPVNGFFAQIKHPSRVSPPNQGMPGVSSFTDNEQSQLGFLNTLNGTNYNLNLGGTSIDYNYPAYAMPTPSQKFIEPAAPTNFGGGYQYPAFQMP